MFKLIILNAPPLGCPIGEFFVMSHVLLSGSIRRLAGDVSRRGVLATAFFALAGSLSAQPILLKTFTGGVGNWSSLKELHAADGYLYFLAEDGENDGERASLWRTDGSPEGTFMLRNIQPYITRPGPHSNYRGGMATLGENLFFFVEGTNGFQLWRSDGTPEGTLKLHDTPATDYTSAPHGLTSVDTNHIYFAAYSGLEGMELWRTDADSLAATLVSDIFPGEDPSSGKKNSSSPADFVGAGSTLFFSAEDGAHGRELWKVAPRGTTELVRDIFPGESLRGLNSSAPSDLVFTGYENTTLSEVVLFSADSPDGRKPPRSTRQVWRSDGSAGGTFQVSDIKWGTTSGPPTSLTPVYDQTFYVADQDGVGNELWVTKTPGVALVKDIFPGDPPFGAPSPANLTRANDLLYFTADDGVHGRELWRSDGSLEGTYMVRDLMPGSTDSDPSHLIFHAGRLYFGADTVSNGGTALWQSDGTASGTVRVDQAHPELGVLLEAPRGWRDDLGMAVMDDDLYVAIGRSPFSRHGWLWVIPGEGDRYASWLDGYALAGDARRVTDDPDGDGLVNLLEYAFGRDPARSDQGNLPALTFVDGQLALRYLGLRGDLDYAVEVATDLAPGTDWSAVAPAETKAGTQVTAVLPAATGTRFYRLVVTLKAE